MAARRHFLTAQKQTARPRRLGRAVVSLSRRPLLVSLGIRRGTSYRNRNSVRRPGRSSSARSTRGHSSDSDGTCHGSSGAGGTSCGSTSGHSSSSARAHSRPARSSSSAREHSSSAHSSDSDGTCHGSSGAGGTSCGSTSGHSSSSARARSIRPAHSTKARAHNRTAHNSRRRGGLRPGWPKARTGRQTATPATQYGISWTELLNRNSGDSTSPSPAKAKCLWRIVLRDSQAWRCSDRLTLSLGGKASLLVIVDLG